jgi:hypothetical protein
MTKLSVVKVPIVASTAGLKSGIGDAQRQLDAFRQKNNQRAEGLSALGFAGVGGSFRAIGAGTMLGGSGAVGLAAGAAVAAAGLARAMLEVQAAANEAAKVMADLASKGGTLTALSRTALTPDAARNAIPGQPTFGSALMETLASGGGAGSISQLVSGLGGTLGEFVNVWIQEVGKLLNGSVPYGFLSGTNWRRVQQAGIVTGGPASEGYGAAEELRRLREESARESLLELRRR